jgi:YVTN family beta-propeller protein
MSLRMSRRMFQQAALPVAALAVLSSIASLAQAATELLYVGNTRDATISVISIPEHEVIKTWRVSGDPDDIVATSDGKTLYVSASGHPTPSGFPDKGSILALDTRDGKVLWELPLEAWPHHISLTRDDRTLYAPLFNSDYVAAVDAQKRKVTNKLYGLYGMHGTRLSNDDSRLYAGAILTSAMYVFDTRTGKQINSIAFPEGVRPFAITADQNTAYVQLSKLHGFAVVDLASGATRRIIQLPPMAPGVKMPERFPFNVNHGLELSPDERYLLAAGSLEGKIEVYTVPELNHVATIQVGPDPNWIVFSSDGAFAYVSSRMNNEISVIDMKSLSEVKRITGLGEGPSRMRIAPVPKY